MGLEKVKEDFQGQEIMNWGWILREDLIKFSILIYMNNLQQSINSSSDNSLVWTSVLTSLNLIFSIIKPRTQCCCEDWEKCMNSIFLSTWHNLSPQSKCILFLLQGEKGQILKIIPEILQSIKYISDIYLTLQWKKNDHIQL